MNELKKVSTNFEIVEFNDKKAFGIIKDNKKISIYDKELTEELIDKKFMNEYKKILYIIMDINESEDANETDVFLVRDRLEELKNLLVSKYSKYIKKELLNKYLKMLLILEGKLVIPERSRGR